MNTSMSEKEIKRSEEIADNWLRLEWSYDVNRIAARYIDESDICERLLDIVVDRAVDIGLDANNEDEYLRVRATVTEAMVEAQGKKDTFYHYAGYLWELDKAWFQDHDEAMFDDIVKELL